MRAILTLLFISLFIFSCKKSDDQFEVNASTPCFDLTILPTNIQDGLEAVFFINEKEGFVAGYNGGIYKTTNSGGSWTALNSNIDLPVRDLFFINSQKGFAVGGLNHCSGNGCTPPGGFILKTTNGGKTWRKVYTPSDKIEISSIYFVNSQIGFCVGNNIVLKTIDGGQTWSDYKINNLGGTMTQVRFVDPLKGYIACMFDKVVKTNDGGLTWQVVSPQRNQGYYSVAAVNHAIYVSGQKKLIKSIDGGNSWIDLPNSPSDIFAIHFIDDQKGFAFGRGIYSGGDYGHTAGSMFCTSDGGISWNGTDNVKETGAISAVSFPTNDLGYALSGNNLIRLSVK